MHFQLSLLYENTITDITIIYKSAMLVVIMSVYSSFFSEDASHRSQSYLLLSCSFPLLTKVTSHSLFLITFAKYMYNYNMIGLFMPGEGNIFNETLVTLVTDIPCLPCHI